jgi:hypothetical protein
MNMIESVKKLRNMNTDIHTDTNIDVHKIKSPSTSPSDAINNNN